MISMLDVDILCKQGIYNIIPSPSCHTKQIKTNTLVVKITIVLLQEKAFTMVAL